MATAKQAHKDAQAFFGELFQGHLAPYQGQTLKHIRHNVATGTITIEVEDIP